MLEKNEGTLTYLNDQGTAVAPEAMYSCFTLAAPYLELIEELTLLEFFQFHFGLKPLLPGFTLVQVMEYIGLAEARHKYIRHFSSGMKQRVKLAQAVFAHVPMVLLDEPTANLDVKGAALYHQMVEELLPQRLLIVCSNDESEISFCQERIDITAYKP
jgi:ABC-type multidrug transport system ATPase subunit